MLWVEAFDTNAFTWPAGVSNSGPYTLVSVISNYTVITPNGSAPVENDPLTHRYHHHVVMARAGYVTFLAASSAGAQEDQDGQQCHIYVSMNNGRTWSNPIVILPSQSQWTTNIFQTGKRIPYPRNATCYGGIIILRSQSIR